MQPLCVAVLCALVATSIAGTGCGYPCQKNDDCLDDQCSRCVNSTAGSYCVRGGMQGDACNVDTDCFKLGTEDGHDLECKDHKCKTVSGSNKSLALGFGAAVVAMLGFGSNFVVVKKYETGNGIFFQWIMSIAIWFVGLTVNIVRGGPQFHPYAMVGGILWSCGNICVVPIISCIGLALGMCLWGSTNLISGWLSGTVGLFGVNKDHMENSTKQAYNILGVCLAVVGTALFSCVKPGNPDKDVTTDDGDSVNQCEPLLPPGEQSWEEKLSPNARRLTGVGLALFSGIFYGINFDMPTHLMDHFRTLSEDGQPHYSPHGIDYVFSHFCGIILACTFWFIVYGVYTHNKPKVYPEAILPGLASGLIWAVAQTSWFIANEQLDLSVSFPLVCSGPMIISSCWGIIWFKEVSGKRNAMFMGAAFTVVLTAITFITLSKV